MQSLHPFLQNFIFCALALWPLIRLYQRVGLNPIWSLLVFSSLVLPFSGLLLALLPITIKTWPKFPPMPKPEKPVKVAI